MFEVASCGPRFTISLKRSRLQLRWSTQDRQQGRPRAGGIFRKPSPLTMSRIFRSRRRNNQENEYSHQALTSRARAFVAAVNLRLGKMEAPATIHTGASVMSTRVGGRARDIA